MTQVANASSYFVASSHKPHSRQWSRKTLAVASRADLPTASAVGGTRTPTPTSDRIGPISFVRHHIGPFFLRFNLHSARIRHAPTSRVANISFAPKSFAESPPGRKAITNVKPVCNATENISPVTAATLDAHYSTHNSAVIIESSTHGTKFRVPGEAVGAISSRLPPNLIGRLAGCVSLPVYASGLFFSTYPVEGAA